MFKNKNVPSLVLTLLFFIFGVVSNVYASPVITSVLLNGSPQGITFNPNNGESISIEVKASVPVKFTRLYICSIDQICNGTSGNYIRYFTQSNISDTILKTWNGKKSGDTEIVPDGEYKIMVSMTEGTNDPILEFGQYSIFVNPTNSSGTTTGQSIEGTNTGTTTTNPITRVVHISAHSSSEEISEYSENAFETSAGRARMALVGSIIEFNAKYSIKSSAGCVPIFKWVFGDGFQSGVKDTTHTYKYPGEYNVILNGSCGEYSSVSRTVVKVTAPNISISSLVTDDIEIVNLGKVEINIGNWKIKAGPKDFTLPQDTIISPYNKLTLSHEDTGNTKSITRVSLNDPRDKEVASFIKKPIVDSLILPTTIATSSIQIVSEPQISIEMAESLLAGYKKSLALKNKVNEEVPETIEDKKVSDIDRVENTASVLEAVGTPVKAGFWSKLINIPVRGVSNLMKKFYDF